MRDESSDELSGDWSPARQHGWSGMGVVLTGFGQAIDVNAYHPSTRYTAGSENKEKHGSDILPEIYRKNFLYEVDYYGYLNIICELLYQVPLDTKLHQGKRVRVV